MRGVRAGGVALLATGLVAGVLVLVPWASASSGVVGKPCKVAGKEAINTQGRALVCQKNRKGKLVWVLKKVTPTLPRRSVSRAVTSRSGSARDRDPTSSWTSASTTRANSIRPPAPLRPS